MTDKTKARTYLTGKDLVADVMAGQTRVLIPDIPGMILAKHGVQVPLNSVRRYVSLLGDDGVLCYVARSTVSDRLAAGIAWCPDLPPKAGTTAREKKRRPNLAVQYALLKTVYLLDTPSGARAVRNSIWRFGANLALPPLASAHRNLSVLESMGVLKRTKTGWEARPAQAETLLAEWKSIIEPDVPDYFLHSAPAPLDPDLRALLS